MDFETFREQFMEDVKEAYMKASGREVTVSPHKINKMNDAYEAITVSLIGSSIGLNLNVDAYYEAYNLGKAYDDLVDKAVEVIQNHIDFTPAVEVSTFTDYEQMKETLAMEVVSADRNKEMLETVPHQMMEDMAVVYRFVIDMDQGSRGTILVTNQMLDSMGVSAEQLHEDALKIAPELYPVVIKGMTEVLFDLMGNDSEAPFPLDELPTDEKMYVATVPDKIHGAGVIAYQEFMDQAAERLGGDFFILPSSIHELILVKDDGSADFNELKSIVETVNAEQVALAEQLTDNVYHYDSKDKVFELAERFAERQAQKEKEDKETLEKNSVLDDIKTKKDEVAKQHKKDTIEKAAKTKGAEL